MAEKETIMKLKVNLQCEKCYKKVNKVLCKFPQIRDQEYLVKDNLVVIKVVCCNPEKIRDEICCKGCCVIKTIVTQRPIPIGVCCGECYAGRPGGPCTKPATPPPTGCPSPKSFPIGLCCEECYAGRPGGPCTKPVTPPPTGCPPPRRMCCEECYAGRPGGPCFQGYGRPPICYDGYYGRPRPCYVSRCDQFFSEENAAGCSIM